MGNDYTPPFPILGRFIAIISLVIMLTAAMWLLWSGHLHIRYSGDHEETISIWNKWIPAVVGVILIRLIPIRLVGYNPLYDINQRLLVIHSWGLMMGGILFTTTLLLVREQGMAFQMWYIGLKLVFLLFIPWMMFRFYQSNQSNQSNRSTPAKARSITRSYWFAPLIVLSVWVYLSFFSVFAPPNVPSGFTDPSMLIVALLIGFLMNSVLEEFFYRVWLQTRLEILLGTWPAILLTSILWASWHIAIQGTGQWDVDMATVIANHGVTGLFLGYLWARYRNVWVLIMVHGLINAPPSYLLDILFN
jgi:uncharacterized protein